MSEQQSRDSMCSLTQGELLALALEASRLGESGHALTYLKESAARADAEGPTLFMLGSEYAQLGLIEEAKDSMARAVEQSPDFPLARFQLGLLHLTSGDVPTALNVWEPLTSLDAAHPQAYLAAFHRGMRHLIADEFDAALLALREGIALNRDNEPLNGDMARLATSIEQLPGRERAAAVTAAPQPSSETDAEPSHLFISAYAKSGKPH